MTNKTNILGENTGTGKYNPDLAREVARQAEIEEKQAKLEAKTKKPEQPVEQVTNPISSAPEKSGFIFVPKLGLYITDMPYLQSYSWNNTQLLIQNDGMRMPTIPEFIEFVKYIKSPEGQKKERLAKIILENILFINQYEENIKHEWLDAKFVMIAGKMCVNYHSFDNNGKIIKKQEELEPYLGGDVTPGIDLNQWLKNHTKQGLPPLKPLTIVGRLHYFAPVEDKVAYFSMGSNEIKFGCIRDSHRSYPPTGIRYVAHPTKFTK